MASASSKTDQIVDKKLEVDDDIKSDGEEKPESEDVSMVEKSGKMKDSNPPTRVEVNLKELEDESGIPQVPDDVSEAAENDDLNAPISAEVSVNDLQLQSAFPEQQKQQKTIEIQEPAIDSAGETVQSSSHEEKGSGHAQTVEKKEKTENPVETTEAKNSTDFSAAQLSSDQGRAPETAEMLEEKEKDMGFNIEKDNVLPQAIQVPSKDKESESLKDVDATSAKDFTTVEEIEENKNKSSKNDKEVPAEFAAEVMKGIGSSEMAEEKKNDSKEHSVVEENVQIPDDKKEEAQIDEAIQIATDKSEKKKLGAEKEESEKPKDVVDPILSFDTAHTKLIKEPTKRESNNLFSKVKRSIVKAKKAILGPKTALSEIKIDDS